MQTFTVVQEPVLEEWVVLDANGEERHRTTRSDHALAFAALLASQAADAYQDALQGEAVTFISEAHRDGQSRAYSHAAMRLSFLLGGTLPPAQKLQEARKLVATLDEWAFENKAKAREIKEAREARLARVR